MDIVTRGEFSMVDDMLPVRCWRKFGARDAFLIEVMNSIHPKAPEDEFISACEGPYRWFVYVYLYKNFPGFQELLKTKRRFAEDWHLHGGVSYYQEITSSNGFGITSSNGFGSNTVVKIGVDYHHLGDTAFTWMDTAESARKVFEDAAVLLQQLNFIVEGFPNPTVVEF